VPSARHSSTIPRVSLSTQRAISTSRTRTITHCA
jgi:hypothetical protein